MSKLLEFKNRDKRTGKEKVVGKMEFKNQADGNAELLIYGEIVGSEWQKWAEDDVAPLDIQNYLKEIDGKDVDVYINSPGGSIFAGIAIYNMLKRHKGTINTYVDGIAASIASVFFFAGDNRYIPSNAYLMIHKGWNRVTGNAKELIKAANVLMQLDETILNIYKEHLNDEGDLEKLNQLIDEETWLEGPDAAKYFNVNLIEANNAAACMSECMDSYKNVPDLFKNREHRPTNDNQEDTEKINRAKARLLLECAL